MIKLEKDFQAKFGPWFVEHGKTACYELKISHGNTVAFSKFEDQQLPSLWLAYTTGKNVKMTDASIGLKPFDGFMAKKCLAFIGVMFNVPTNQKEFYLIHIKDVVQLKKAGAKSITKKDCEKLGNMYSF